MKNQLLPGISCFIILLFSTLAFAQNVRVVKYVPGEILVKYKDAASRGAVNNLNSRIGSVRKKEFKRVRIDHVKLPDDMSVESGVEYYSQDGNVEYAEPNYIVHATATPDDPSLIELWGFHNTGQTVNGTSGTDDADIDAPEAWELTTGNSNVVIAVIDSGVAYNHPDLNANIWSNPGETSCIDGIDNDSNGYIDDCNGWDFIGNDNDPNDYHDGVGHGTHVAGTIAAVGNNTDGITGVMWQARIMPIRFLGVTGEGSTDDAISAIEYANDNGAHVINNSWGGYGFSQALKDVIDASPAVLVCAAGNEATDNDAVPHYPSSFTSSNLISVAATDSSDGLASFSNYGRTSVDVAAPGVDIYSSIPQHGYGASVDVYTGSGAENFNSTTGVLPTSGDVLGWRRGGTNSTWEITGGTGVGGTNSLEDSPGGNYVNNTSSWAGYMTQITSEKDNIYTLSFQWKGDLEDNVDFLDINYSTNAVTWDWIDFRTGTQGSFFSDSSEALTGIAAMYNSFFFGFGLDSDNSNGNDGVYIDDVQLTRKPVTITGFSYDYYEGTSMAAPHVSGVAGLIKALLPGLTNLEIKNAILKGIDGKSSLQWKTLTGGRLNAFNALNYAQSPYGPTNLAASVASVSQINLSWVDNSAAEEGFHVERKNGLGGTYSVIADLGPDSTSYSDTSLRSAITYYYRVRVYAASYGGYVYSNEASAASVSTLGHGSYGKSHGCFIATAAYGSRLHPYVKVLRAFRDRYLLDNSSGRAFVDLYYRYSPPVADMIRDNETLRFITRVMLTPFVMSVVFPYTSLGVFIVMMSVSLVLLRKRKKALRFATGLSKFRQDE